MLQRSLARSFPICLDMRSAGVVALLAALVALAPAAEAIADGPAVESANGKLSIDGMRFDGESASFLDGSLALPLTRDFGAQLDGAAGVISQDDFAYAVGGQVFRRDPESWLLGLRGAYADRPEQGLQVRRLGASGELYRGDFSAIGEWGYNRGDNGNGGYGSLRVIYYANDDLALSVGGELGPGSKGDSLNLRAEYQSSLTTLRDFTLFADGAFGEDDFDAIRVGVRYYFDEKPRTLKLRHRTQDPDGIGALLSKLGERKRKAQPSGGMTQIDPPSLQLDAGPADR